MSKKELEEIFSVEEMEKLNLKQIKKPIVRIIYPNTLSGSYNNNLPNYVRGEIITTIPEKDYKTSTHFMKSEVFFSLSQQAYAFVFYKPK